MAKGFDLGTSGLALRRIHLRCPETRQSPLGAAQDRGRDLQIAQQGGGSGRCGGQLGFEKQLGLVEKALANQGRGVAPGGIQLPGLSAVAVILSEYGGQALAVAQADARHRHQKFHGDVGGELALAHLLLEGFREKIHQG